MAKSDEGVAGVTIQAVERAVGLMEAFFEHGRSLSLAEVASSTGLAPATVHRLLATMIKIGWIEQDPSSSRYKLSQHVLGSAAMALASSTFLREGQHCLSQIAEATGLNSFLAVRRGSSSVLLARELGRSGSSSDFHVGKSLPLYASASGKLFLAFMPSHERRELLSSLELKALTSRTIVDVGTLEDELAAIVAAGYANDRSELHDSYRSVAVPVRQANGEVHAALCAGWWAFQLTDTREQEEAVLREMLPAAAEFSRIQTQSEHW